MKYLIESKATGSIATVEYADDGNIECLRFDGGNEQGKAWLLQNLPVRSMDFIEWSKGMVKVFNIHQLYFDLTFTSFWEAYAYKVGKKDRAERLWSVLSESDRSLAITKIKAYKAWLAYRPGVEMLYPETYLSQRRWENEFKT